MFCSWRAAGLKSGLKAEEIRGSSRQPIGCGNWSRTERGLKWTLPSRAERRLGELMDEQPRAKPPKFEGPRRVIKKPEAPTLADAGIDKNLAHRARRLAAMPEEEFERHDAGYRKTRVAGRVSASLSGF